MSRLPPSPSPLLPRRAVLAGSLAAVAGPPPLLAKPLASSNVELSERGRLVRRLAAVLWSAIEEELDLENTPAHEAAYARADALQAQFDALAEEVWDQPPRSWADVVTRAEIAQADSPDFPDCLKDRALKELLAAVLAMGGQHA